MRDEAERRIGHLYPKVEITADMAVDRPDLKPYVGHKLTVIAWLWARTVKSPNPAVADVDVPLASTFVLSTKGGTYAYVEPILEEGGYRFAVKIANRIDATVSSGTKLARGANFRCLVSGSPIEGDYIKAEGIAGRIGACMLAVVAEADGKRVYLPPTPEMESIARTATPVWEPPGELANDVRAFTLLLYGMSKWSDLFTRRQMLALTTFADLVSGAHDRVLSDMVSTGMAIDANGLEAKGNGARAYADAVALYLAFAVSKAADRNSSLCVWETSMDRLRGTFGRQALPVVWDFAETNPFAGAGGDLYGTVRSLCEVLDKFGSVNAGCVEQRDARTQTISTGRVVSTDPPYYDNVGYADLSDFFYVWLRHSLRRLLPSLFGTLATPKTEELVAARHRHLSKRDAEAFFLDGMTQAMHRIAEQAHFCFPVTIYYAFKQSERDSADGVVSTGWETFLDAVLRAGFSVSGTWPMRTELGNRMRGMDSNALASSIVLVCRPRASSLKAVTRRELIAALKAELPQALTNLQRGNIAPVDLAQAAIGPGMAVFTRFSRVVDAEGKALSVRHALALINETLDEVLAEQEGDFDVDSRWALAWFDQYAFGDGPYGEAEVLATAKANSIGGLVESGILVSRAGKVRLFSPAELPTAWDPEEDRRINVWEMLHHLIRVFEHAGEAAAAQLLAKYGSKADVVRELAYRLYTACERKKRAKEAGSYNALVQSWPEIARLAKEQPAAVQEQVALFDQE